MVSHFVQRLIARVAPRRSTTPALALAHDRPLPLTLPALPAVIAACPVARKYHALLHPLPWHALPERPTDRPWPGPRPHARAPFVAAFLIKLHEGVPSMGRLRTWLIEHPALIWLLGFPLIPDPTAPLGFDGAASVPSATRFSRVLRALPNATAQFLLTASVDHIRSLLPPDQQAAFATTIVGDTKHILAWVKENNPKQWIGEGRFDPARQPAGDPDCKLGIKKRHNRDAATAPPTPTTDPLPASSVPVASTTLWGYATGVVVTTVRGWGELVLAERTRPFNEDDISYFAPLMQQTEQRLGFRPANGAWDAAYDAHYVYDYFHQAGGIAAVPLNAGKRGGDRQFDSQGLPLCAAGLAMPLKMTYWDRTTNLIPHERGKYACPLRFPAPNGEVCPIADPHWERGGCVTTMATSAGARVRLQLDRTSPTYRTLYAQRSAAERINSQAKALGIERPNLRNQQSITNQNTLLYVVINLRVVLRQQARQR